MTRRRLAADELDAVIAEIRAIPDEPLTVLDIEIEDIDFSITPERAAPPSLPTRPATKPRGATVKISLRVPTRTLVAFKDRASRTGARYQSLIIAELRRAVAGWSA
jgi:hypothetical protein